MPTRPLTNPGVIAVTLPRNYRKILFAHALSVADIHKMNQARRRAERAEQRKAKAAEAVKAALRAAIEKQAQSS
jgi:hypothetical protein